jgi:hypothetical protein
LAGVVPDGAALAEALAEVSAEASAEALAEALAEVSAEVSAEATPILSAASIPGCRDCGGQRLMPLSMEQLSLKRDTVTHTQV